MMKLLKTIQDLIQEAEDNLYEAAMKNSSSDELLSLDKKVEDSMNLLDIFRKLT